MGDVARLAIEREYDVKRCNLDKATILLWYQEYCKQKGPGCKVVFND